MNVMWFIEGREFDGRIWSQYPRAVERRLLAI